MPHATTAGRPAERSTGPWLTSQVMWANVLRYVEPEGVTVDRIHERSRTSRDSLAGLRRWGYITVNPWKGTASGGRAAEGAVVRPTEAGRQAQQVWGALGPAIDQRWRDRFGLATVDQLRRALESIADQSDFPLPRYLPVIYPTQNGKALPAILSADRPFEDGSESEEDTDLSVLLARVLLMFTLDFETESRISLPISANSLRVLDAAGVRVRDLPVRTGVSKEANAMAVGFLERHGCVEVLPDAQAKRGKVVRLTAKGQGAQAKYGRILTITEERWRSRFGSEPLSTLHRSLEELAGDRESSGESLLFRGTEPYPDGWRATVRRPAILPHYPMVLHRGGYPDGS
jgi:DNA-binding MarR family transcriptional regulator